MVLLLFRPVEVITGKMHYGDPDLKGRHFFKCRNAALN
jgi:hypothetical protein